MLFKRLLLEPCYKCADEPHVPHIIREGNFFDPTAAGPVFAVLVAGSVNKVGLAGFDVNNGKMGNNFLDHTLLRVLDPVDDVTVLQFLLEYPCREDIFRQHFDGVFTARALDLSGRSKISSDILPPLGTHNHVLAVQIEGSRGKDTV